MKAAFFLLLPIVNYCFSQAPGTIPSRKTATELLGANDEQKGGIPLYLPKVLFTVSATQTKTTVQAGGFFVKEYVQGLLDAGVILSESATAGYLDSLARGLKITGFELGDVAVTPFSVIDENRRFVVYPGRKWNKDQNLEISYGEDGTISSSKMENKDKTIGVITDVLGAVGTIVGKVLSSFFLSSESQRFTSIEEHLKPAEIEERRKVYENLTDTQKKILKADSILNEYLRLNKIKESLITNMGSMSQPDVFNKQLDLIDKKQKTLLESITWSSTQKTTMIKLDTDPSDRVLFYFDAVTGLKVRRLAYDSSYNRYTLPKGISLLNEAGTNACIALSISYPGFQSNDAPTIYPNVPADFDTASKKAKSYLLPYNQPKLISAKIFKIEDEVSTQLINGHFWVPQFGPVAYLSAKNQSIEISYQPLTGALKSTKASSTATLGDDAKKAGETAGGIIDNFKKPSELETLENTRKILEEKDKIKKLQEAAAE